MKQMFQGCRSWRKKLKPIKIVFQKARVTWIRIACTIELHDIDFLLCLLFYELRLFSPDS